MRSIDQHQEEVEVRSVVVAWNNHDTINLCLEWIIHGL